MNKNDWLRRQYIGVMDKFQKEIVASVEASELDTLSLLLEPLTSSYTPWDLAWVSFENEVLENKPQLAMLSSTATTWGKAKIAMNIEMAWAIGSDFQ